jgi:hypothetical protein
VPVDRRTVVAQAPEALPVLVSEIGDFFLLFESTPPDIRHRLVYATVPEPLREFNPEAQIVAENWHRLKPELPIVNAPDFFTQNSRFYLLQTPGHYEPTLSWLQSHGGLKIVNKALLSFCWRTPMDKKAGVRLKISVRPRAEIA